MAAQDSGATHASAGTGGFRGTTTQLLQRNAQNDPDGVFVSFMDTRWTHRDTYDRALSVAAGLTAIGVEPGTHVGSWLPNCGEALLGLLGVNVAGAVQVPLNTAYRGRLLEHALNLSEVSVLVLHHSLVERLTRLDLPHLQTLVVVGGPPEEGPWTTLAWDALASTPPMPEDELPERMAWDDMIIIMTSGTTGPSKAVRCSYAHHSAYGDWYQVDGRGSEHRYLAVMPMFHIGGSGLVFGALQAGGSVAMLPRFRTDTFWDDVRTLGATVATLADSMASFLLNSEASPQDRDHPLELVFATGLLAPELARRFGVQIQIGFAMSEAPGPLRSSPPEERFSCGKVWGGWEARLVDEHDLEVAHGMTGELVLRHRDPWVLMSGYINDPEANAKVWRNGWFHTGDQLRADENGIFFFVDRKGDVLRRRGENISSFEVEAGLLSHPRVVEVAVVGVPAAEGEHEVLAFVVVDSLSPVPSYEELLRHAVAELPHFMVPRYLELVSGLPKTPTGKIRKVELREHGVGTETWDREAAGHSVTSTRF